MISNVGDRQPRSNHTKPRIEGSQLTQKRLEGRIAYSSFLLPRRILDAALGHPESARFDDARSVSPIFRPSPTPLPTRGSAISEPSREQRREIPLQTKCPHCFPVCKTTSRKQAARVDSVQAAIRLSQWLTSVDLPYASPGNDCNHIYVLVCPCVIQKSQILLSPKQIASCNG